VVLCGARTSGHVAYSGSEGTAVLSAGLLPTTHLADRVACSGTPATAATAEAAAMSPALP
jgi:hypothetical protein